ncbi:WXG100-like domain-containing protein [Mycobacterium camsae]|uniref:WXG100-like domain-containing protein n=1 Tax=Mycobacterium gordonae TaxID=1778 RepID=UPI0019804F57|nr:secretion protein EspK [Mycobacterium gordonae]
MGIPKPFGGHAEQMLEPDAWPEADEDVLFDRAHAWTRILHQVDEVLGANRRHRAEMFECDGWRGAAAAAAADELSRNIDQLVALQHMLATVITWQRHVAGSIVDAKAAISDNVEIANQRINVIVNDPRLTAHSRRTAIDALVGEAYLENAGVVAATAELIQVSRSWQPPNGALENLLDQKVPPTFTVAVPDWESTTLGNGDSPAGQRPPPPVPDNAAPSPPRVDADTILPVTPKPTPVDPAPGEGTRPPAPATRPPNWSGPTSSSPVNAPVGATSGGWPGPIPSTTPSGQTVPSRPATPSAPTGPAKPLYPATATKPPATGEHSLEAAGAAPVAAQSSSHLAGEQALSATSNMGGMPMGPMAAPASSAAGGGRSGGGTAPAVSNGSAKPAASVRQAAANRAVETFRMANDDLIGSGDREQPAEHAQDGAAAMIPVSAARMERDAIAEAAAADAARRQGTDPLRLGRRIAAALNAPGKGRPVDLGFYWITAVTADGAIVVANSYGLAYLPDGMRLPDEVHMASADSTIPAAVRARWATYPVMAVQGWATHHDRKLRVVIGTEQQLANSDSGAAKIVLQPDDIPAAGDMPGRTRLEVVDRAASDLLAATTDARLIQLLPPAPTIAEQRRSREPAGSEEPGKGAPMVPARLAKRLRDIAPPPPQPATASRRDEQLTRLWLAVSKPLASSHPDRQAVHLGAFRTYAAQAQSVLLIEARQATDPVAQRVAVADWLYWKCIARLMDAALADAA